MREEKTLTKETAHRPFNSVSPPRNLNHQSLLIGRIRLLDSPWLACEMSPDQTERDARISPCFTDKTVTLHVLRELRASECELNEACSITLRQKAYHFILGEAHVPARREDEDGDRDARDEAVVAFSLS